VLGSLITHEQMIVHIKKEKPDIWAKFEKGFGIVGKMADYADKTMKFLGYFQKAIGYFTGDNSDLPMLPPE